ncbi:MAG: tRNA 2-thiouridine(34) synthase MnmA [bacterium]|nr:tRNA 2-thiouridine(34) synthase MnmA [bacterium]
MTKSPKNKVFVAMSGGVDSSVAAALLKKQGYDVTGVFMKNWTQPVETYSKKKSLCWIDERRDAIRVAAKLGIPLLTFNFEKEYRKWVVDYMFRGYKAGRTPNPDIQCNKLIKFPLFLKRARKMGADFIATGHYIKLKTKNLKLKTFYKPYQAKDKEKDQSYFLWTLNQEQLKYCLFPIGDYLKSEVRQMAEKLGLQNALKKGTSGICFIGEVKLKEFLKKKIKEKPGKIITTEGKVVGRHPGIFYFTIGQRHGLEVSGKKPYYVAAKDVKNNVLIVAEGENNPALYKKEIKLKDVNFINPDYFSSLIRANKRIGVLARVRYRQPLAKAELVISNKELVTRKNRKPLVASYCLLFAKPVKFVASGQSAVFYSKAGEMLGGGIIF